MMMTGRYLKQLNRTYESQTKLMEQSDGDKLHRPSDDAVGYSKFLRYGSNKVENEQYQANVKTAISWMRNSDSALTDMSDRIKTVVVKSNAAQGTMTESDMKAIAGEMLVQVQQAVSDGNAQIGDRYLFSGQNDLIQPYAMSTDYKDRGIPKTLDDKQAEFFSGSTTPGPVKSGDITQMLTLKGDDGNTYFMNTISGDIYTEEFVEEGYKAVMSDTVAMSDPNYLTGKQAGTSSTFASNKVHHYFNEYGVINTEGEGFSEEITVDGKKVTVKLATIKQHIVTYHGDKREFSMVKENGAVQPASDSVNASGADIAGYSIFDNEEAYASGSYPGPSGAAAFNDLLTVVAKCEKADDRWMSSDGKHLAENSFNIVNTAQSKLAARQQVYTDCQDMLTTMNEQITQDITDVHSTDIAKLSVSLMEAQTVYQLSLSVGSRILPPTLADYL